MTITLPRRLSFFNIIAFFLLNIKTIMVFVHQSSNHCLNVICTCGYEVYSICVMAGLSILDHYFDDSILYYWRCLLCLSIRVFYHIFMATYNLYAKNFYSIQQHVKKLLMKNNLVITKGTTVALVLCYIQMYIILAYIHRYFVSLIRYISLLSSCNHIELLNYIERETTR